MLSTDFQSKTIYWNPMVGPCYNDCFHCVNKKFHKQCLQFVDTPLVTKNNYIVQVCPSLDILSFTVDLFVTSKDRATCTSDLLKIIGTIANNPNITFLIKTKNPKYLLSLQLLPNLIWGIECETDLIIKTNAPYGYDRLNTVESYKQRRPTLRIALFITPILKFSASFASQIIRISPEIVVIGGLKKPIKDEPTGDEIRMLLKLLSDSSIRVILNKSVKRLLRD